MAAAFLLLLLAAGAAQAAVPEPCRGDPASRCQDAAARCSGERECPDLRDSPALERGAGWGGGKKICSLCVKILEQVRESAGEDPDEAAVDSALGRVCRALGRRLSRVCRSLLKKYRRKIAEAVRSGEEPRQGCAAIGLCKD